MFFLLVALLSGLFQASAQAPARSVKADLPAQDEIRMQAVTQDSNGALRYLHHDAKIEMSDVRITADEMEFNSDTNWVTAHGNVRLEHFATGDKLEADHGEYNLKTQEGKFYVVSGTSPAKIMTSPGVLTTTNPFYFQAKWAERIKDRYILHQGFLTDCRMPKPWWTFEAPVFDVVPGDRAIARHTVFRLKRVPIFYLPYFYRPLGKNPRQSGFLTPNIGHSTFYGFMYGGGYYWAINRSYDTTAVVQYFTSRGPALRYNFRGKPNQVTDFNFSLYGVDDIKGDPNRSAGDPLKQQGGVQFELTAKTQIWGFNGVLDYNYLSSFLFRQAFAYSFSSQNNSIGFLQRRFKDDFYTLTFAAQRDQLFESPTGLDQRANQVIVQKLPSVEFSGRDRQIAGGSIPLWFSFSTNAMLLNRLEPTGINTTAGGSPAEVFRTGNLSRLNLAPRLMSELNFKGFTLNPSVAFGATDYSNSYATNTTTYTPVSGCGYSACPPQPNTTVALSGSSLFRKNADLAVNLRFPTLERIYAPPKWLHLGEKMKHVVEAEATYEYVTGIDQFQKTLRFDALDILSDTNQITYSLTNRFFKKDKAGNVSEVITWKLAQAHYFDPTFGGVVTSNQGACAQNAGVLISQNPTCQRVVVLATAELTPFSFLDRPRDYSPVISSLNFNPYSFLGFGYRAEYDPIRHKFVDHTIGANFRHSKYFASLGETAVTTNPILIPQQNQLSLGGGYGNSNRKGWNVAGSIFFDVLTSRRLYDFAQVSYNTDCCGFSFELRNYNLGIRQDNQYLFSFSVANIGTFGSLQKQSRIF